METFSQPRFFFPDDLSFFQVDKKQPAHSMSLKLTASDSLAGQRTLGFPCPPNKCRGYRNMQSCLAFTGCWGAEFMWSHSPNKHCTTEPFPWILFLFLFFHWHSVSLYNPGWHWTEAPSCRSLLSADFTGVCLSPCLVTKFWVCNVHSFISLGLYKSLSFHCGKCTAFLLSLPCVTWLFWATCPSQVL